MSKTSKASVPPGLLFISDNIKSKQNIIGAPKTEKAKWAKGIEFSDNKDTIFFAGCGYQYSSALESMMSLIKKTEKSVFGADMAMGFASSFQKKLGINAGDMYRKVMTRESEDEAQPLKDAVKVLKNIGIEFGYLAEEEPCCGGLLYYSGLREDFVKNAVETYNKLKSFGVKKVISIVPSCTYSLKTLLTEYIKDADIEVKHFAEIVFENIGKKSLKYPGAVKVTYHDPCQLGRYLGVIDEPRAILRAIKGIELVEPEWTKGVMSTCCGGGGGFEVVFPELSGKLAESRTEELVKTGAQIIVTQCPGCIMQLNHGLKELKRDDIKVLDLAQIVAMSMEG